MLFNSLDFAIFLPTVFLIYWFILKNRLGAQNNFLLFASYIFYGWWDWRFLLLIFLSSIVDYKIGLLLSTEQREKKRKLLLWMSLLVNLGILGVFKYFNFFLYNFSQAFSLFGQELETDYLHIVLPVGISFYTFQTLSYTIDIYRKNMVPTRNFLLFAAYVSFFPQLVAGPIERAKHLLPQFEKPRLFSYPMAVDGLRQILWGLFKKVVIADSCAFFVNMIFASNEQFAGSTLIIGAVLFAFQIYCDFSGYSDIAIGTAKLFGFDLMKNFAYPYFARDIAEFWRRWHISLTTWFRDYLYIPLGGSRGGTAMKVRNTFIIFVISGFWHGASWTFVVWGLLNALYFLPLLLTGKNRANLEIVAYKGKLPSFRELIHMLTTFGITCVAWVFFRAESLAHALEYLAGIFTLSTFSIPEVKPFYLFLLLFFLVAVEWRGRRDNFAIEKIGKGHPRLQRWAFYSCILFLIGMFMQDQKSPFIYFQF